MNLPEHNMLIELFAIFVWAKVFGEAFEHLLLPAVLGEILAGVVLGPHAIGLIVPGEFTNSLAELGAVFLLFTVGLETRPEDLLRVGARALGVALGGVVLPFAAGFAYIILTWRSPHEATFVGAAMVATSVGITARVLGDLNLLSTRPARIILGAAVFDDILGMLVLAVVVGLAASGTVQWLNLSVLVIEAAAFALFMIFVAPKLISRIRPQLAAISLQNAPLLLAIAICLGLSAVAQEIGMAAIIGAFFAGLAFAEYAPEWNLKPRVTGTTEFVAPFFFFTIGSRFDLGLFTPQLLLTACIVSVLAIVTKLVGCGLPVLREGWPTALQVGVGMVPRGEVGLIVALLGTDMRLISSSAYAVVVFMTATTTLLAPPVLRHFLRREVALETLEGKAELRRTLSVKGIVKPLLGTVACAGLAGTAAVLFQQQPSRVFVPLGFLIIIALVATTLGRTAGILGSLAAASIFASFLFTPVGSLVVRESAARANLGWMLLAGVAVSYFFGARSAASTET